MKALNPAPCSVVANPEMVTRHVFCRHYGTCLDFAVAKNWDSFTCGCCTAYARESKSFDQWAEEAVRCLTLLHFVTYSCLSLKITRNSSSYGMKRRDEYPAHGPYEMESSPQDSEAGFDETGMM